MVIFHSYVSLPKGVYIYVVCIYTVYVNIVYFILYVVYMGIF